MATKLTKQQQNQLNDLFEETIIGALVEDMTFTKESTAQLAIDYLINRLENLDVEAIVQ